MKEISDVNCYITTNKDNLYGLADNDGNVLVENSYLYMDYLFNEYFSVYKEGKGLGIIDKTGNIVVDFDYDVLSRVGDKDIVKAVDMGKKKVETTIFDKDVEKSVTMSEANISIYDNYIQVYNKNNIYFLDNEGHEKDEKDLFPSNKLFGSKENDKWGFVDASGTNIVPCDYELVTEFNKYGFAGIKKDGKWGIVDESGNVVCECSFKFEDSIKPEFLGKFYKTHKDNGEICYADEVSEFSEGL